MRKSIKSFIAMLILVLGMLQLSFVSFAKISIPTATSEFYVNDFANVFSTDEETRLIDNAIALSEQYDGVQVVITTIDSLNGTTIENYALEMYNQYEIGKNDMGLLILLSTNDRQIRIEIGKAMESYINDSKAGRFIDNYAIPYLKENKFDEGLINLQEALIKEISTNIPNPENIQSQDNSDIYSFLVNFLISSIIVVVIVGALLVVYKVITLNKKKQKMLDNLKKQLEENQNNANLQYQKLLSKFSTCKSERDKLINDYKILQESYKTLQDRYRRVQLLYPSADSKVSNMIEEEIRQKDISTANQADSIIQPLLSLTANKNIVSDISKALKAYSQLTPKQQSYVKSDINKLMQLYEESYILKEQHDQKIAEEKNKKLASDALSSISDIISYINRGNSDNFNKLKRAKSIYEDLPYEAQKYFDISISSKLDNLYRQAQRDKAEKEERRRRYHSTSYSSRFNSFSSHNRGFGGLSGGGGASRNF